MATTMRPAVATEGDLLRAPSDGRKYELVDGRLRVSPAGSRHGAVCAQIVTLLNVFVRQRRLGRVFDSSTGFRLPGGNVRVPDVSFVGEGRFEGELPTGFADLAPDLAVEVLSPDDRSRDVLDKVGEYLQAGVRRVWVVDPALRRAVIYSSPTDVVRLDAEGALDGEDVVPGFRCRLADVLD
jgi:Uma2 family endonuclease